MKRICTVLVILGISFSLLACLEKWEKDVSVNGITFEIIRKSSSGTFIARIASDTDIDGYPCQKGWVHFHDNWRIQNFTNYREIIVDGVTIPEGTWVELAENGALALCAFPQNQLVQGYLVYGSGGAMGAHTTFHTDAANRGMLQSFFSPLDVCIDGIPCSGGALGKLFHPIRLYPDGRLQYCVLSQSVTIEGIRYKKGAALSFDQNGKVLKAE